MTARVWFMDVDGVLSPFGKGGAFRDWVRSPHPQYELWLSPSQAQLIRGILQRTDTELVWVTTWAHEAAACIEQVLGWPTHRFAPRPHPDAKGADIDPATGRWWKLDAVQRLLEELQPARFVWSDDDLPSHRGAVTRTLATVDTTGLLQAPKAHVGLSRRWLREAEDHLASAAPGGGGLEWRVHSPG